MTIVSLKSEDSLSNGLLKAELSDGSELSFSTYYLPEEVKPVFCKEDQELASREEEAFRFAAACYLAEKAALKLIARAEQNSMGLTAKLEQRGHKTAAVKAVVLRLLDRNLLNDERYSELWLRSRLSRGKRISPRWLLVSLGKRGIDRNSSHRALQKVLNPETEYTLLLKYVEKTGVPGDEKEEIPRAWLKCEGFSSAVLDKYFCSC